VDCAESFEVGRRFSEVGRQFLPVIIITCKCGNIYEKYDSKFAFSPDSAKLRRVGKVKILLKNRRDDKSSSQSVR
jgi:hypothetical protein